MTIKKQLLTILSLILLSNPLLAEVDLSTYDLKPEQIELIRKMEAKGKYTEEFLHKLALAIHKTNTQNQHQEYIPPYTETELQETIEWARGGAFAAFANYAGMRFLGEEYRADCPNVALFRFGRATGTEFIKTDVLKEALNMSHYFQSNFSRDKESFPEIFKEAARQYGFMKYLVEL